MERDRIPIPVGLSGPDMEAWRDGWIAGMQGREPSLLEMAMDRAIAFIHGYEAGAEARRVRDGSPEVS
jgi:hypothetical protein